MVVEGQGGIVAPLNCLRNVAHQRVEGLGTIHQTDGKDQLRVLLILDFDRDVVLGEHVIGAKSELEGVSEVDRDGDICCEALLDRCPYRGLRCQHPRGPGQMHRHRVDVDAGDGETQPFQRVLGTEGSGLGCLYEVGDCFGDECSRPAGGVEDVLVHWVGHHFPHDGARQPVWRVVLSELAALIGWYDGLVEDGGNVVGSLLPVEPGYAPGQGPEQGHPSHLGGPRKKVRLHDPLKTGLASKVAAKEEVRRIVLRQAPNVAAEGRLDHHAYDGAQVGMSDEQVVQLIA